MLSGSSFKHCASSVPTKKVWGNIPVPCFYELSYLWPCLPCVWILVLVTDFPWSVPPCTDRMLSTLIKHSVTVNVFKKKRKKLFAEKPKNFQVIPAEVFLNPATGNNRLLFAELWRNFGRVLSCIWHLNSTDLNKNYVPEFQEDLGLSAVDVDFGYRSAFVGSLV